MFTIVPVTTPKNTTKTTDNQLSDRSCIRKQKIVLTLSQSQFVILPPPGTEESSSNRELLSQSQGYFLATVTVL
ncbi:hypothetical protein Mapa_003455 [Marchantia paleacea]|nr:hypothetical protein Mapa_003455 [Marchantia paleacea]